jgi:hypothetical protein
LRQRCSDYAIGSDQGISNLGGNGGSCSACIYLGDVGWILGGVMRVGLAQVDGKWPNLALMKISAWYKKQGDQVGWFSPLEKFDRVYASKIFRDTPDDPYLPIGVIKGGTGHDKGFICSQLSGEMERCEPDYSIYPQFKPAIGFTTRGCIRQCPFCIVPRKEGLLKIVAKVKNILQDRTELILLDNNLTAAPFDHFKETLEFLINNRISTDFSQGIDIRLLNDEHASLLSQVKLLKQIPFAWDDPGIEKQVREGIQRIKKYMLPYKVKCYVLIGFNTTPEEDLHRVEVLRGLSVDPFVMPYNKNDLYQKRFARWVNRKEIFKSVKWEDYKTN